VRVRNKQCAVCPWKVGTDPNDIPNGYCATKHANLSDTIADEGIESLNHRRAMACHEHDAADEVPCVGWVAHQLGPGNNIGLRMLARDGRFNNLEVEGPQHARFEDTLPTDQ
jgi:hypothetical protein